MEIANQEDHDMPIPLNSTFGGSHGHMIHQHHDHHPVTSAPPTHNNITTHQPPQNPLHGNGHGNNNNYDHHHHQDPHHVGYNAIIKKPMIKYKECLKNHASAMGGNATDGCGEFMPSGEDGSIEALTCSACNCHRNFHRKEVEGEPAATAISPYHQPPQSRKLMVNHHKIRSAMPHQMIMPIGVSNYRYMHNNSESDDFMEEDGVTTASRPQPQPPYNQKKRFRTKFTPEQKEKMLSFAEKVGWKIQRQEDCVVQRFCEEIGVKRRVLKVWMHNNKLHFSKKNNINLEDNDNEKINNLNNVDLSGNNDVTKIVP